MGQTSSDARSDTTIARSLSGFVVDDLEYLFLDRDADRQQSKTLIAYSAVRRAIVTHELPAAHPLDEAMLRSHFGAGRTPLREALKRLTHERFLFWPERQAPIIRDVGLEELSRLYETRMHLEPQIATLAAARATPGDMARIELLCELLSHASNQGDTYLSVELDFAFHAALAQSTQNRFLREASDNLNRQSLRLWYRSQRSLGVARVSELHIALAAAIRDGDTDAAMRLAHEHVQRSADRQSQINGIPILQNR